MSSDSGAIAGPEVDMAKMETGSLAVDLSLNLGPSFALELTVGGGGFDSEGSISISRHNWPPRFEPRMTGMLQEEEALTMANHPPAVVASPGSERGAAFESAPGSLAPVLSPPPGPRLCIRRNPRSTMLYRPLRPLMSDPDGPQSSPDSNEPQVSTDQVGPTGLGPRLRREISVTAALEEIGPGGEKKSKKGVEEDEGAGQIGAHFECNICLETATEPVVTCCGHLFCWTCLHQWLHVHARQKDCPVCKGSLFDGAITPIYGRGSGKHLNKPDINIPPRPSACRISNERDQQDPSLQENINASVEHAERGDLQRSSVAAARGDVLNRLRVAQRLQMEHSAEFFRTRLRRRLMEHRERILQASISSIANGQAAGSDSINVLQNQGEQLLNFRAMTHLGTVDSLAAIEASMDGLRENLAHMQRSLERASSISEQVGRLVSDEGSTSRLPDLVASHIDEASLAAMRPVENVNEGQSWQGSSGEYMHQGESSSSGAFDAEPSSLRARKRRRLNQDT